MTDKEIIFNGLNCGICPEKKRCDEQKERQNDTIDILLQNIKDTAQAYRCDLSSKIEKLRQTLPNITRCGVVLEKQLQRKEQEYEELKVNAKDTYELYKALQESFEILLEENNKLKEKLYQIEDIVRPINNELSEDNVLREIMLILNDCNGLTPSRYKQTLEEINEIALGAYNKRYIDAVGVGKAIVNIINEVKDELN